MVEIYKESTFRIDAVYNGVDGLNSARTGIYDIVILDIMLPQLDGLAVLRTLREEKNAVPVLLLTAKEDVADKVEGLDSGADDYMTKPFSTEELLARVRALTRRKGDVRDDNLSLGDLALNRKNCEIVSIVTGQALKLALKEYQIIELLFRHPHEVITKEAIIERIWGDRSTAEYNNVEVYISFIRKKMEFLKVKTVIRTARGIGYSLEESSDRP